MYILLPEDFKHISFSLKIFKTSQYLHKAPINTAPKVLKSDKCFILFDGYIRAKA